MLSFDTMPNLYRNFKIIILFLFVAVAYTACRYPYNTPQARAWRKTLQAEKKAAKSKANSPDSLPKIVAVDTSKTPDSLPKTNMKANKGKLNNMAKIDSSALDSNRLDSNGMKIVKIDSLPADSALIDSNIVKNDSTKMRKIEFSKDSLDAQVEYNAKDSMIYDLVDRKIYLYGSAEVAYKEFRLTAGYIVIDLLNTTATAEGVTDSTTGRERGRPAFKDGEQSFECTRIVYNFRTNKGKVFEASTQQGDGYFLSESTKFISKTGQKDTEDDIIYSENCLYTTCDRRHAHFGIRGTKAKVIPNKLIVLGPSYLEIMGLPTPIVLPFAFFPLNQKQGRRSGLILSTNIEFSPTFGPGLRGMGYYWAINDYVDLAVTTDLYMRGSFRVNATSNYSRRYKYRGALSVGYSRLLFDAVPRKEVQQDFNIRWDYTQDNKAHPSQSFNASVNFGTSDYFRNTTNSANQVLQGQFNSNISYTKRFTGTPFSLMLSAAHTQSVQTRVMTITAPKMDIRMNQIFPFKRKISKNSWYEKIAVGYNMNFQNRGSIVDTVLFAPDGFQKFLDTMEYNVVHNPSVTMNFKLFNLINVQPSIKYTEHWFFQAKARQFDNTLFIASDTTRDQDGNITQIKQDTTFGKLVEEKERGFYAVRDLSAGVNMNTQMFLYNTFSMGRLHRLRAMVRPDVGFRWRPDYQSDFWGYYDFLPTDSRYPDRLQSYRRYSYVPSGGKSALLTYNLSGRLEGKWRRNEVDSLTGEKYRNIILINNWTLGGDYNMAVDSFQWSVVRMGANTTILKQINFTWAATFDPYTADRETNARLQAFEWGENRRLVRLTSMSINVTGTATSQNLREWFGKKKKTPALPLTNQQQLQNQKREFLQNINLSYNMTFSRRYFEGKDTTQYSSNELSMSGNFNLSRNWTFRVGRVGYDFTNKRITYPDFTLARDLHCWEMGINWQPAPERRTWAFYLRVKPSSLGFINIPARKTVFDEI
jgi:hypothetical protein